MQPTLESRPALSNFCVNEFGILCKRQVKRKRNRRKMSWKFNWDGVFALACLLAGGSVCGYLWLKGFLWVLEVVF